jgi:hypothetical protein
MAVDFQVIFPQESIKLTRIRLTPPSPLGLPPGLDIFGDDFTAVDEVMINDVQSPDVIILSKNRLIAQMPTLYERNRVVNSVKVLSRRLTVTKRSVIRFRIGDSPGRVQGILRLLQKFLKILFTTPGTDIFSPRTGGAGLKNIGETFGIDEGRDVVRDFIISVRNTTRQIIAIQGRDPRIPRDERLLAAKVLQGGFNRETTALVAKVEITSQAGHAAITNVEL